MNLVIMRSEQFSGVASNTFQSSDNVTTTRFSVFPIIMSMTKYEIVSFIKNDFVEAGEYQLPRKY